MGVTFPELKTQNSTSGCLSSFQQRCHSKDTSKIAVLRDVLKKQTKAEFSYVKNMLILLKLRVLDAKYFTNLMLRYDQGITSKNEKT